MKMSSTGGADVLVLVEAGLGLEFGVAFWNASRISEASNAFLSPAADEPQDS